MTATFIASQYKIIDTLTDLNYEKIYLCENIQEDDRLCIVKQYFLDDSNHKIIKNFILAVENIQKNINLNQLRFLPVLNIIKEEKEIILIENIVQGISLKQLINNDNYWNETEAINNLKFLLESLRIMHQNNYIHHNINPENIIKLLSANESLLITNLDVNPTDEFNLIATITVEDKMYIAPERIRGKSVIASDIYSLGMVIITMLIGEKITHLSTDEKDKIIWETEIDINPHLSSILNKMIATDLVDRYQNVEEILQDLNKSFTGNNQNQYAPTEIITSENEVKNKTNLSSNKSSFVEEKEAKITELIIEPNPHNDNYNHSINQVNAVTEINHPEPQNLSETGSSFHYMPGFKISKSSIKIAFIVVFILFFGAILNIYLYNRKVNNIINDLQTFYDEQKYNDCIVLLNSDDVKSLSMVDEITTKFFGKCWLGLAQIEASNQNYEQAIINATKISNDSPEYENATKLIDDWSGKLIEQATNIYHVQGNLELAIQKLDKVPESSSKKKEALDLKEQWENGINCPPILCP